MAKGGHALAVEGPAARAVTRAETSAATKTATREVARVSASESEGNLIPFPVGIPYGGGSQTIQIPPVRTREPEGSMPSSWREQVREKVKASRERKVEASTPAPPAAPSTPAASRQAKEITGAGGPRPHNELVESALSRIRRTTADLTASARAPRAMPAPPSVRPPAPREEANRPVPPSQEEERLSSVVPPASLPDAPAARQQGVLAPTPGVIRERSEGRQVVTVPPTAPPTRTKTTDELVQDARRLAQQAAPPMEAPPEREVSQPPARPRVETEIIPLSTLLRSLGMQEERPASFWIRSMAGGWDLEVLAVAYLPIFASYATVNTILARETLVVLAALLVVLVFVYQSVTLLLAGRTFGMAMQQLRLAPLAAGETRIYWHQHLRRAAGATLAFCCPPLNLLARALHRRGLSIPDQFSGTIPVEIPRSLRTR